MKIFVFITLVFVSLLANPLSVQYWEKHEKDIGLKLSQCDELAGLKVNKNRVGVDEKKVELFNQGCKNAHEAAKNIEKNAIAKLKADPNSNKDLLKPCKDALVKAIGKKPKIGAKKKDFHAWRESYKVYMKDLMAKDFVKSVQCRLVLIPYLLGDSKN